MIFWINEKTFSCNFRKIEYNENRKIVSFTFLLCIMLVIRKDKKLKEIYENKRAGMFPKAVETNLTFTVGFLEEAETLQEVYQFTSFHLEKLKWGKYKGKHSIRLNKQRRLILVVETEPELTLILEEITDYH